MSSSQIVGEGPARHQVSVEVGRQYALVEIIVPDAVALSAPALESAVEDAYQAVRRLSGDCARPYPLRFWNLIPRLNEAMEPQGHSRYMVFNGGRFKSLTSWFGKPGIASWGVPTATGVGYPGRDLRIACLLGVASGEPVENQRQRSSYRYTRKYGPLPPCFARATRIRTGDESLLLLGGTASVRGQRSVHAGSLESQFNETCANINSLLALIFPYDQATAKQIPFNHLRAYVRDRGHLEKCRELIKRNFPLSTPPEVLHMELCRPELLVEMEGVVAIPEGECS